MSAVRAVVLRTAGTNCDAESVHALQRAGATVERVHLHAVTAEPERLRAYGIVLLPGGFTYGDDIASGAVFAVEMRDRVVPLLRRHVADGALVLGICNGFQILTRSGLLPGRSDASPGEPLRPTASLQPNASGRFECRWVRLECTTDRSPFLRRGQVIDCPVAHAEGRFVTDDATRASLEAAGQVALRYTVPPGRNEPPASVAGGDVPYPWNPNGSRDHVAAIADSTGRILGLMPHPERNVEPWNHPRWTRGDAAAGNGIALFENAVHAARGDFA